MPAPNSQYQVQELPLTIAGGTHYGRYPKISVEQTWNMIVSDGFLVPYAGYKNILTVAPTNKGRGIHSSSRGGFMVAVLGSEVLRINYSSTFQTFSAVPIGNLETNAGDVYINENNNGMILISDGIHVYKYTWAGTPVPFGIEATFTFQNPGYIAFINGQFIVVSEGTTNWYLSGFNDSVFSNTPAFVGSLQAKPDFIQAVVPIPGGSQNVMVFGNNVAELWQNQGTALFPYQRNNTFNSDFGCLNPSTIASLKNYIVWIGINEQSGPVLMAMFGNDVQSISTDGIEFTIGNLTNPSNCTGFLFQQDGHVIYQFTFPDDNISYAYDFETKLFFSVSDQDLSYHIAREVVYFGPTNNYYFVSLQGGNIYQFSSTFPDAEYYPTSILPIPRIRITAPLRLPSQRYFIIKSLGFTIEQGQPNRVNTVVVTNNVSGTDITTENGVVIITESGDIITTELTASSTPVASYVTTDAAVFLSISRDGGQTFGSSLRMPMNPTGKYKSRFIFQRLGQANDVTFQIRLVGSIRFVLSDGEVEIYQ